MAQFPFWCECNTNSPSSATPPALSYGLGELSVIWMLPFFCEYSLITSPQSARPVSMGPGCLPYLPLLSHLTPQSERERDMKRMTERESIKRLPVFPEVCCRIICFSVPLLLSSLFFSQPDTINGVLSQTSFCLDLKCSVLLLFPCRGWSIYCPTFSILVLNIKPLCTQLYKILCFVTDSLSCVCIPGQS